MGPKNSLKQPDRKLIFHSSHPDYCNEHRLIMVSSDLSLCGDVFILCDENRRFKIFQRIATNRIIFACRKNKLLNELLRLLTAFNTNYNPRQKV